jgi:hypothetical protein
MACRGVNRLGMARGRAIAAAIVQGAQVRAAFEHLARNPDIRLTRVVARVRDVPPGIQIMFGKAGA